MEFYISLIELDISLIPLYICEMEFYISLIALDISFNHLEICANIFTNL